MFIHNFKYTFRILFRNKALIFWTFAFPIILGSFFKMAFSNIINSEKLNVIDIAIVNNDEFNSNQIYADTFKKLSDKKNKDRLFNTKYTSLNKAQKLLDDDKIIGYLSIENNQPKLVFNKNGLEQTILNYTVLEIESTANIITNITSKEVQNQTKMGSVDYDKIYNHVNDLLGTEAKLNDKSNTNLDYMMIEFYALIAMTCLYGGVLSMYSINQNLPNMSNKGKRVAVSSSKKGVIVLSSLLASFIAQLIGLIILFAFTIFVLDVNYGSNTALVVLLALAGSLAGLALGLLIGTVVKAGENAKSGILIGITMFFCFLTGMMGVTMKYVIDKNVPLLARINPANMITDGFYSLYYYDTLNRYWFNIISLLIFAFVLIILSFMSLRRQKYDSI